MESTGDLGGGKRGCGWYLVAVSGRDWRIVFGRIERPNHRFMFLFLFCFGF